MNLQKIDTSFVSDIDEFLTEFDKKHIKTESQQAEINKHQRLAKLRDDAEADQKDGQIWEGF